MVIPSPGHLLAEGGDTSTDTAHGKYFWDEELPGIQQCKAFCAAREMSPGIFFPGERVGCTSQTDLAEQRGDPGEGIFALSATNRSKTPPFQGKVNKSVLTSEGKLPPSAPSSPGLCCCSKARGCRKTHGMKNKVAHKSATIRREF